MKKWQICCEPHTFSDGIFGKKTVQFFLLHLMHEMQLCLRVYPTIHFLNLCFIFFRYHSINYYSFSYSSKVAFTTA